MLLDGLTPLVRMRDGVEIKVISPAPPPPIYKRRFRIPYTRFKPRFGRFAKIVGDTGKLADIFSFFSSHLRIIPPGYYVAIQLLT